MDTFKNLEIDMSIESKRFAFYEIVTAFGAFIQKTREDVMDSGLSSSEKISALQAIHSADNIVKRHVFSRVFFEDIHPLSTSMRKDRIDACQLPAILTSLNYGLKGASDDLRETLNSVLFRAQANQKLDAFEDTRSLEKIIENQVEWNPVVDYSIPESNAIGQAKRGAQRVIIDVISRELDKREGVNFSRIENLLRTYDAFIEKITLEGSLAQTKKEIAEVLQGALADVSMESINAPYIPIKELSQVINRVVDRMTASPQSLMPSEPSH